MEMTSPYHYILICLYVHYNFYLCFHVSVLYIYVLIYILQLWKQMQIHLFPNLIVFNIIVQGQ